MKFNQETCAKEKVKFFWKHVDINYQTNLLKKHAIKTTHNFDNLNNFCQKFYFVRDQPALIKSLKRENL